MDFLYAALQPINLPFTALMAFVLLYWLSVLVGVLDLDTLDVDLDVDADTDVDTDVHLDGNAFAQVLHFFNVGEMPIMIICSFWFLFMWVISIFSNHFMDNQSGIVAMGLAFPNIVLSLFLTKFSTWPFKRIFQQMTQAEDTSAVGKECELILPVSAERMGQARVQAGSYHQTIYVKTADESMILPKGKKALVIAYDETEKCYWIEPVF
ncbi:hypothetical protein [Algivirga pacifica]|uniref:DUF1449 family protein n=1 Tax=Algivirga pacifica TaxID=1162670 RepID=A0ABP9D4V7_9BACT